MRIFQEDRRLTDGTLESSLGWKYSSHVPSLLCVIRLTSGTHGTCIHGETVDVEVLESLVSTTDRRRLGRFVPPRVNRRSEERSSVEGCTLGDDVLDLQ